MALHPFHPIIYVRGFAATQGEIEETVADPYMGFNIGSTKSRRKWDGELSRFYFESPMVRLMADHKYDDVYVDGDDLLQAVQTNHRIAYRSIIIHRYYDQASRSFGSGDTPPITEFATGLSTLIHGLREKICAQPALTDKTTGEIIEPAIAPEDFRVHLVAHSMGGLVCRAFLQNPTCDPGNVRDVVDKLFTYATPHNGIDMRIVRNVPGWVTFGDVNNFNRDKMAEYLAIPRKNDDVSLVTNFSPNHVFNLIGTNPRDYGSAGGLSAWAVGEASDGLVRIENATTHGDVGGVDIKSPSAFVNRSHSGHFGIVNSEEGFQNLTRFLFGTVRVDGYLDIAAITLPPAVAAAKADNKEVRASYQFEVAANVRGAQWQMTRREVRENSAIFRKWDDLFPGDGTKPDFARSPRLFSMFLDPAKAIVDGTIGFSFDLKVLVPDYIVDKRLAKDQHYEGGYIYRQMILVVATRAPAEPSGWTFQYGVQDESAGAASKPIAATRIAVPGQQTHYQIAIPIQQQQDPGLTGTLRIEIRSWNDAPRK